MAERDVSAIRTPFTRSIKGGLANMYPEELLAIVLKETISRTRIPVEEIQDIVTGTVLQKLGGQKTSAAAIKNVKFGESTTSCTINRQCASSAQALSSIAYAIRSNALDCGIAAGVESMTFDYFPHRGIPERIAPAFDKSTVQDSKDVFMPMGITSENVAREYGISRDDQDLFAESSHLKAAKAQENNYFDREIAPVHARQFVKNRTGCGPTDEISYSTVSRDDGVRKDTTYEKLAKLKPVFLENGTTTAGNSSQISDGASAVLVMRRSVAERLGIQPIGKFVNSLVAGVPCRIMGIAPAIAIPKLLELNGIKTSDIDLWELNEAFASQSLYVTRSLGIDMEKVNPFGGAIALGHPLGATGGRCITTLLNGLKTTGGRLGIVSMCASTGQGYAGLFVRE
ncbi:Thiolase, N-terminal domain-containing protein [Dipodascopsis uninucleata]